MYLRGAGYCTSIVKVNSIVTKQVSVFQGLQRGKLHWANIRMCYSLSLSEVHTEETP